MKEINKELLTKISMGSLPLLNGVHTSERNFSDPYTNNVMFQQSSTSLVDDILEPSKIHSLYQDLFVTDLKNDISDINIQLQTEKEEGIHKDNLIKLL